VGRKGAAANGEGGSLAFRPRAQIRNQTKVSEKLGPDRPISQTYMQRRSTRPKGGERKRGVSLEEAAWCRKEGGAKGLGVWREENDNNIPSW